MHESGAAARVGNGSSGTSGRHHAGTRICGVAEGREYLRRSEGVHGEESTSVERKPVIVYKYSRYPTSRVSPVSSLSFMLVRAFAVSHQILSWVLSNKDNQE